MSCTSRSRSRSISPTVLQESISSTEAESLVEESPTLIDSDSESGSVSILLGLDLQDKENVATHRSGSCAPIPVVTVDESQSQKCKSSSNSLTSPVSSPLLPIITTVGSRPTQTPTCLSATAGSDAYAWAISRMCGQPPDRHTPFPFIGHTSMPGHTTVIGNPTHSHPHAQSTSLSVQVRLMPSTRGDTDGDVVDHFHRIISNRKNCFKPFYMGATTRQPLERFNLPCRLPHSEIYDGIVVRWVGNATDAQRIERSKMQSSSPSSVWRPWIPWRCLGRPPDPMAMPRAMMCYAILCYARL